MKSLTTVELMLEPLYEDDSLYPALQELPHLTDLHFHDFSEKNGKFNIIDNDVLTHSQKLV